MLKNKLVPVLRSFSVVGLSLVSLFSFSVKATEIVPYSHRQDLVSYNDYNTQVANYNYSDHAVTEYNQKVSANEVVNVLQAVRKTTNKLCKKIAKTSQKRIIRRFDLVNRTLEKIQKAFGDSDFDRLAVGQKALYQWRKLCVTLAKENALLTKQELAKGLIRVIELEILLFWLTKN